MGGTGNNGKISNHGHNQDNRILSWTFARTTEKTWGNFTKILQEILNGRNKHEFYTKNHGARHLVTWTNKSEDAQKQLDCIQIIYKQRKWVKLADTKGNANINSDY